MYIWRKQRGSQTWMKFLHGFTTIIGSRLRIRKQDSHSHSSLTAALWLCCFGYSSSRLDCMNGQENDQYFITLGTGTGMDGIMGSIHETERGKRKPSSWMSFLWPEVTTHSPRVVCHLSRRPTPTLTSQNFPSASASPSSKFGTEDSTENGSGSKCCEFQGCPNLFYFMCLFINQLFLALSHL